MSIGTILEGECEDEHEQMYADVPRPHVEDGANRAQSRSDGMAHASLISEEEEDEGDDNEWHDDAEEDDWDLGVGASLGGARRRSARLSTSTIASQATAETTVDTPSAASTSELQLHASPLDADGAITPSGAGRGVAPIRMAPCMSAPSSRTSSVSAHAADASPRLTPISAVVSALLPPSTVEYVAERALPRATAWLRRPQLLEAAVDAADPTARQRLVR